MDTLRGQDRAIDALRRDFDADRLHHAYIFHGPPGVGKFTAALAFARLLLHADHDQHPDLHVITKELARFSDDAQTRNRKLRNIPIDVVRAELLEPVYRSASVPGGRKVFIVDEAELLDHTGQNAMLKTLEEPPTGTVLILVTSSEERLLPTIRSRCRRLAFAPLDDAVIADWLGSRATGAQRDAVLRFAQGSIGRAELALDYGLTDWVTRVLAAIDAIATGRADARLGADIHRFVDDFAAEWVKRHDNASKEAANQFGAALMYGLIAGHAACRLRDTDDEVRLESWLAVIDVVERARALQATNVHATLVADHLAAQIAGCFEVQGSAA